MESKTKEQIIFEVCNWYSKGYLPEQVPSKCVLKAMDFFANQECNDLMVFVRNNWQLIENNKWWNEKTNQYLYSEELYFYYLQSKTKS